MIGIVIAISIVHHHLKGNVIVDTAETAIIITTIAVTAVAGGAEEHLRDRYRTITIRRKCISYNRRRQRTGILWHVCYRIFVMAVYYYYRIGYCRFFPLLVYGGEQFLTRIRGISILKLLGRGLVKKKAICKNWNQCFHQMECKDGDYFLYYHHLYLPFILYVYQRSPPPILNRWPWNVMISDVV